MKLSYADVIPSRLKFNSHKNHNPECDILELAISSDSFITYCVNINTGWECLEYYLGENYVVNSNNRSHSNYYPKNEIPKKYRAVWNGLKYYYETHFKNS